MVVEIVSIPGVVKTRMVIVQDAAVVRERPMVQCRDGGPIVIGQKVTRLM